MACRVLPLSLVLAVLALAGCGKFDHAERPAWRDHAEEACLAQHLVEPTAALQPAHAIEGPGICGVNHPFKVYALSGGTVRLNSASILDCSMIPALDAWIKDVVQPDAQARFGEAVVQINTMGTYSCRGINNMSGANLSEHAFANAIDVGGFVLASGREVNVMRGWKGEVQDSAFLHDAHAGACNYFTTVLGPGYNIFHYNHVHMDLAMHGNTSRGPRRYCKPVPSDPQVPAPKLDNLPDPPPIEEELDIAQTRVPSPSYASGNAGFVASAPATPSDYRPPARLTPRPLSVATRSPTVTAAPMALMPTPSQPLADDASLDVDQAGGAAPTLAPMQEAPRASGPAPEGRPGDWDITSTIKADQQH